ncbi:anti-sigma regulatory factor [Bacillus marinisedimentorum]|uniref:anti-sigma regulatory factor n=1 Tax=Bacillus marinisedimentorum TaxID=1821260 RepID=UPI0007E0C6F1|nr:anti-sigma regulatory factor [Bacillus marinisedimentorum]
MDKSVIIHIRKEEDIVAARKIGRELSQTLNFQRINQTRVMTAASELARNIFRYAQEGQIEFETIEDHRKRAIKITAQDNGPGIKDIQKALKKGYSTSGGLGAGIPGVKNMMDEFAIDSSPEIGTIVTAVKWQT